MWDRISGWLFDPSGLTPHGFCLLWEPSVLWTHVGSNATTALAYFAIAFALARMAAKRKDIIFRPMFWMFSAFILLCGVTHIVDILTIWYPIYGLESIIMAATAAVSITTAVVLIRALPRILTVPTQQQMQEVQEARQIAEDHLRQAQKMEAIGTITGSVAHDFNNVLQAVQGNLEAARRRLREGRHDLSTLIDNALDATGRAGRLTSQLLSFARRQNLDPKPIDPMEVINGMRALLRRTTGERIALVVEAQPSGACLADQNQLESALMNLVINARDAIVERHGQGGLGTIHITVKPVTVLNAPDDWPPDGRYVKIAVRDNGCGMPASVRKRAFEPFFTTKAPGKGTGLGLPQIYGFAHQSGGTATIDSSVGEGTEVSIILPQTDALPSNQKALDAPAIGGHGEVALVVDDDDLVRMTLAETLDYLGYKTVEAENADAALEVLGSGVPLNIIITDLNMPGSMDGMDFAKVARKLRPRVPVIVTTGTVEPEGALPEGVRFIQKPYSSEEISVVIRNALTEIA